jgi:hypothetical protein
MWSRVGRKSCPSVEMTQMMTSCPLLPMMTSCPLPVPVPVPNILYQVPLVPVPGTGTYLVRYSGRYLLVPVRYGTVRYGTVRYGTVRYGTVRYGTVRYGTVRYLSEEYPATPAGTHDQPRVELYKLGRNIRVFLL